MPGEKPHLNDPEDKLPASSYELIRFLDKSVPAEGIRRGESLEDAHRRAGNREIVDQLLEWMNDEIAEVDSARSP